MNLQNKIYQCIGIPHTALISIILFLMILSFPIGAYLVFNSEIGDDITYEYPMNDLNVFLAGVGFQVPVEFELGDGFIVFMVFVFNFIHCGNIWSKEKFR